MSVGGSEGMAGTGGGGVPKQVPANCTVLRSMEQAVCRLSGRCSQVTGHLRLSAPLVQAVHHLLEEVLLLQGQGPGGASQKGHQSSSPAQEGAAPARPQDKIPHPRQQAQVAAPWLVPAALHSRPALSGPTCDSAKLISSWKWGGSSAAAAPSCTGR